MTNKYYVYEYLDANSNIIFVGHGCGNRDKQKMKELKLDYVPNIIKVMVGLSKQEAANGALAEYYKYKVTGMLLNKCPPHVMKTIECDHFSKYMYYNPASPSGLCWAVSVLGNNQRNIVKRGDFAGTLTKHGYYVIRLDGVSYNAHRIVFSLCHNISLEPNIFVDHKDHNRSNNLIENLRLVSSSGNSRNRSKHGYGTETGVVGVYFDNERGGFKAEWSVDLKRKSKRFHPSKLYPSLPPEEAKRRAFEDAVAYRKQMVDKYYDLPELHNT